MPPRTQLPRALLDGPFTTADARTAGLSAKALRGPAVQRVFDGVYLSSDVEMGHHHRILAALLVLPPKTVVGGVTALQLLGLDVGPISPLRFWTASTAQVRRPGLRVSRLHSLPEHRGRLMAGSAIFHSASADLGLLDLVAAGDFLVRRGRVRPDQLVAGEDARQRGWAQARRAAVLVRELVDSPRETRVRLALTLSGLPEPEVNVALYDHGVFLGTPDLRYRRWRISIEYEGDHHRSGPRQWDYDVRRYERMAAAGEIVIRITGEHLRRPRELVDRVYAALVSHGYQGPPPRFNEEWQALFGLSAR